jgi:hypothetical protein
VDYLMSRIQRNPLTRQLTRSSGEPEKQRQLVMLTLLFSACLIGLNALTPPVTGQAISSLYYSIGRVGFPFAWRLYDSVAGFVATLSLVVLIPPVVAVLTAVSISRHAGSASLQELRVTPLGEKSIVQAYVWSALLRMPVVVALTVGLCVSLLVRAPFIVPRFTFDQLSQLLFALLRVVSTVDVLVRLWLAVMLGVALALWVRQSPMLAGLCAMGVALIVTLTIVGGQLAIRTEIQNSFTVLFSPLRNYSLDGMISSLIRLPLILDILNELVWTGVAAGLAVISTTWAKRGINVERIGEWL